MDKTFVRVPFSIISLLFGVPVGKIFSWGPRGVSFRNFGQQLGVPLSN